MSNHHSGTIANAKSPKGLLEIEAVALRPERAVYLDLRHEIADLLRQPPDDVLSGDPRAHRGRLRYRHPRAISGLPKRSPASRRPAFRMRPGSRRS